MPNNLPIENKILNYPFELKQEDIQEDGTFSGYGSIFGNKDSHSDIVMPGAFTKTILKNGRNGNGVAMLYQHDSRRPIGVWTMLMEDKKGLKVEGKLILGTQDGRETYELMKAGALKGLSIGYDSIIDEIDRDKKVRYLKEVSLWEISPVTFGANIKAQVMNVKKIEIDQIKDIDNERDLEKILRESGLSKCAAQYIVKQMKPGLREAEPEADNSWASDLLDVIKIVNQDMKNIQTAEILSSLKAINL